MRHPRQLIKALPLPHPHIDTNRSAAGGDVDPVVMQVLPGQDVIAEYAVKQWEGVLTFLLDPARQSPPSLPVGLVSEQWLVCAVAALLSLAFCPTDHIHRTPVNQQRPPNPQPHPQPPPQRHEPLDVERLVAAAGLIRDGGDRGLTGSGFRFLLMDTNSQLWVLLREYIRSAEQASCEFKWLRRLGGSRVLSLTFGHQAAPPPACFTAHSGPQPLLSLHPPLQLRSSHRF